MAIRSLTTRLDRFRSDMAERESEKVKGGRSPFSKRSKTCRRVRYVAPT